MKTQPQIKTTSRSATRIAVAALAFCITFAPHVKACGNPINLLTAGGNALALSHKLAPGPPSSLTSSADTAASDNQAGDSGALIVGMWEVTLRTGSVLYDHAFQQFYADGNEMQNSSLFPPEVGNICFGTWQHDGRSVKLKHYGWLFDHGNFVGTLILKATITVGTTQAARNTYSGNFVADVVLPSGQIDPTQHAEGTMQATRLTIE